MDRLTAFVAWVRAALFRRQADAEMDEELRFHLEMEIEHNLHVGMSPTEARRRALVSFGGVERHRERLREGRRLPLLETLWQDVRFGLRSLVRDPWLSALAVFLISLGVGATTAVLSVVNAVLVRPVPLPSIERLFLIQEDRSAGRVSSNGLLHLPYARFEAYREATGEVFESLAGHRRSNFSLRLPDVTISAEAGLTSGDFFAALALRPALGRFYATDDAAEAVLSHDLWMSRFGGDPGVLGTEISANGQPIRVVGVAPAGFQGFTILREEFWLPVQFRGPDRAPGFVTPIGRLRPGVTPAQAAALVDATGRGLPPDEGSTVLRAWLDPVTLIPAEARPMVGAFLGILLGMGGLVLLIASGNVSGMILARSVARQREMAVRLAIGAGRARLVRHLLAETLILFALATAGGIALAHLGTRWAMNLPLPRQFPVFVDLAPDPMVLAMALALTLGSGLAFGLLPALRGSRPETLLALKSGGSGSIGTNQGVQSVVVAGQVALTILLLLTATLFARSLQKGLAIDPGLDPDGVVTAEINLGGFGYDDARWDAFFDELTERVGALPDVGGVTLAQYVPLSGSSQGSQMHRPEAPDEAARALVNNVDPGFFATLGIDIVEGRGFTDQDVEGSTPVAVVNRTLAERLWPGESPLGQRIAGIYGGDREVVGVVRDGRYGSITEAPQGYVYAPNAQWGHTRLAIFARAPGAEAATLRSIQGIVRQLEPDVALEEPGLLSEFVGTGILAHRVAAQLVGVFGLVGLLLAATGIYGMLAFHVAQRTRELGVRRALGAGRSDVVGVVLGRAVWLVAGGAAVGLLLGSGVGTLMRSFLVDLSPLDPVTFVGVPIVLGTVALLACSRPVFRALAIEPSDALRED